MERKLYRFAILTSLLGLLFIAVVIISGTAYPDMLFQVLAPVGLFLIFVSLGLYAFGWIFSMKIAFAELEKKYFG